MKPTRAWLLTPGIVNAFVPNTPGVYILGKAQKAFTPTYAGRSDSDLQQRLGAHARRGQATHFTWRPCDDAREAYLQECVLYHLLRETHVIANHRHPNTPAGQRLHCPCCDALPNKPRRRAEETTAI